VVAEDSAELSGRPELGPERGVDGQAIEQRIELADEDIDTGLRERVAPGDQVEDQPVAQIADGVVGAVAYRADRRVDEGAGVEGDPDGVFGAALVVEGE
jgi:hypothetical protein